MRIMIINWKKLVVNIAHVFILTTQININDLDRDNILIYKVIWKYFNIVAYKTLYGVNDAKPFTY